MVEYKIIEGFGLDKFNEMLARHVGENWMVFGNHQATYTPVGTKYSILLSKSIVS